MPEFKTALGVEHNSPKNCGKSRFVKWA